MTASNGTLGAHPTTSPATTDEAFGYATHEVLNQPPALADYDVYGSDRLLTRIVKTFDAQWAEQKLHDAGRVVGSAHVQELARQANRHLPELRTHDRFGNRVDRIDFHPAWHELMTLAIGHETHALCWNHPQPGAQVARGALSYIWNQGENGICCPIGMTYSAFRCCAAIRRAGPNGARSSARRVTTGGKCAPPPKPAPRSVWG
jgi:putative acyl-CoA dehydrogenase